MNPLKVTVLMLISLLIAEFAEAQYHNDSMSLIRFHYISAMRIPYNEVEVSLIRFYNHKLYKYKVIVESSHLYDDGRYVYSYVDTSYFISVEEFQNIFKLINDIKPSDIYSTATNTDDGSSCEICFGNYENNISYHIRNPGIETQKRKLDDFIKTCHAILKLAKLDPEEILE